MMFRGAGLIFLILLLAGCAALEGPRWAMLGDTSEQAFFLDRQDVQRLDNGNYRYPVKICRYQEGQLHQQDDSRDTSQVLFMEMDCRDKQWLEAGRGVMDQNEKVLFRHLNFAPAPHPVEPGTIHFTAYNYLCGNESIIPQHNHQ